MKLLKKMQSILLAAVFAVGAILLPNIPQTQVSAATGADLSVTTVSATAEKVYDGDYVELYAIVRNNGTDVIEAGVAVNFFIDGGIFQTVKTANAIKANSYTVVKTTAYWEAVFGSHKAIASVNNDKAVEETNYENNNIKSLVMVIDDINPDLSQPADNTVTDIIFASSSVTLKNASGVIVSPNDAENVSVSENTNVEITLGGIYSVSGKCQNGSIDVNVDKTAYPDAVVELDLEGLELSNTTDSPIYVTAIGDECVISAKNGTVNTISDGSNYTNADGDAGAIYSKDDLKIKGKGVLNVNGNSHFGISSSNDLKIWNSTLTVNSVDVGIKGKDSVKIGDPDDLGVEGGYDKLNVTVNTEGGDGIRVTNTEETDKGNMVINGGTVNIKAYADGLYATRSITVNGGTIDIYTYTGAGNSQSSTPSTPGGGFRPGGNQSSSTTTTDISAKGIKTGDTDLSVDGTININGGSISIDSTDDAVHASDSVNITGGTTTVKTGDDGIHADKTLNITEGAVITVTQSYEGLEANDIEIQGGNITISSSNDGLNAAGGNDSSGTAGGGWLPGNMSTSGGTLNISGGYTFVNAGGDGVDSNGDLTISGGTVIVCAYSNGGNGIFDSGDGNYTFTISNATVMAIGTSDMFVTPTVSSYLKNSTTLQPGAILSIADSNGSVLSTLTVPSNINMNGMVFYTSPSYNSNTYKLYKGGSYSGTFDVNGYATGGTVSGATQA